MRVAVQSEKRRAPSRQQRNPSFSANCQADYSHYRWTLDTPEDLGFMRAVYARFDNDDRFHWRDVIALLECEPALVSLNSHVTAKALQEG